MQKKMAIEVKMAICIPLFFISMLIFAPFQYIPEIAKPTFYNSWDSLNWDLGYLGLMLIISMFGAGALIMVNHILNGIWWIIYKIHKEVSSVSSQD